MPSLNMQKSTGLLRLLKNKRQQLLWMLIPLTMAIGIVLLWPNTRCEEVVAEFEVIQREAEEVGLVARLDSLAFGAHCDTFSLVFEKKFWVLTRCKPAAEQLRDSLAVKDFSAFLEAWMQRHRVGTIVYHYPNLSIEYTNSFNGSLSYRLMYNRDALTAQPGNPWMTCAEAEKLKETSFFVRLNEHWYVSAKNRRSSN